MSSRINVDASLWNLYCFTRTWGYTFKLPTKKLTKRSHDGSKKGYLSCAICLFLVAAGNFSYKFENLLNYFWGNDLSFFSLLMKLFEHFNLSISRISSHFKWEFLWVPKMWWYSLLFYVRQMRHQDSHWVKDLVVVFHF